MMKYVKALKIRSNYGIYRDNILFYDNPILNS